jgi:general secretion pathway protein G
MASALRSRRRSEAGFTLIEIMVVVFILGLLITLVAPRILGRTDEARQTKAAADIRAIEVALSMYKLDNGFYPTTEQGLEALVAPPTTGLVPRRWKEGGYLEKARVPLDPWDSPYVFESDGAQYVIRSFGADGSEGGDGPAADIDSRDL